MDSPPGDLRTVSGRLEAKRDHRLPVLPGGFEYAGRTFRSLSAVAHAITGSHWNGYHFFGLTKSTKETA